MTFLFDDTTIILVFIPSQEQCSNESLQSLSSSTLGNQFDNHDDPTVMVTSLLVYVHTNRLNCIQQFNKLFFNTLPRGIASVVGFVILLLVLVLLLMLTKCHYQRVCGTIIKRLTIGLTTASMICILTYALQLKHYFNSQGDTVFCEVDGFLVMYTSSVQLLFTIGSSLVLFVKVWQATISWKPLDDFCKKVKAKILTCCGCKM